MISFLEGELKVNSPTDLVVSVGGVGFHVHIPLSSYDPGRALNREIKVLTHLHVREDTMALYGFMTDGERDLFQLLISVSGIGPPMAQKILSGTEVSDFHNQVAGEDVKGLTRIKGIGPKLAQRIVLELRDRIGMVSQFAPVDSLDAAGDTLLAEATGALVGLGTPPAQARKTVGEVLQDLGEGTGVEEVIRQALRRL
jgi:Holliday junction DNA helicase RuvA